MERKTDRKRGVELLVGLFVVAGFAALLFTALQAANLGSFSWSQKTYTVEAIAEVEPLRHDEPVEETPALPDEPVDGQMSLFLPDVE